MASPHPANQHISSAELAVTQSKLVNAGVRYCLGAYVDIHGVPKAKVVPLPFYKRPKQ